MQKYKVQYVGLYNRNYHFSFNKDKNIIISFPCDSICRFRIHGTVPHESIMVKHGFIKERITNTNARIEDIDDYYRLTCGELVVTILKNKPEIIVRDNKGSTLLKSDYISRVNPGSMSLLEFNKTTKEQFYGFGFQRKTLDANGQILTFKKEYRWDEATVPYFLSSSGYGLFSANTYDHTFDFTKKNIYNITINSGDIDFFIINGPSYKKIINGYTAISGRPYMAPKWSLGLCYVARLFENQKGLLDIAKQFRSEGIPCDMLGLEPGWEKYYYQMKWEWNNDMFPDPKKMIETIHNLGYKFELWETGDAPLSGYMNPDIRKKWFSERIDTSLSIGVDFFKQDDPYPRCISSEEMVNEPTVDIFIKDDGNYSSNETKNIANTLYSATVFDEMQRVTNKRAFIIFHSYGATISSQMYPCAWAGDFNLGNGALNAGLSGHAMVTQDMRSEVPSGIHFGFLMPFVFMDSWAYYLEPWLFSDHIKEMIRFYSRFRVSLFPYLYTAMWQSHKTGIPMLRPMLLEFQDDPATPSLDEQFFLGDSLLVGINPDRGSSIYLPAGKWIDFWNRTKINSSGEFFKCDWPSYVGGPLFIKAGAMIPMMNSTDSITLNKMDFLLLDIYPDGESSFELYEDNGTNYDYEDGQYSISNFNCYENEQELQIKLGVLEGHSSDQLPVKAILCKVFLDKIPKEVSLGSHPLSEYDSMDTLINSFKSGWFYSLEKSSLFIKHSDLWRFSEKLDDLDSFYNGTIDWMENSKPETVEISITKSSLIKSNCKKKSISSEKCMNQSKLYNYEFNVVVNPPKRVKLNHGDNWLPHYIYVSFEIVKNNERLSWSNPEVSLVISHIDNLTEDITYTTSSLDGTGHFKRIVVSNASEPPKITLTLSAEGVKSKTIIYNLQTTDV